MNFNTLISPSNFRPLKFLNPKSFLPPFPIGKSTNTHHQHHHCYHRRIRLITSCIDHNKHGLQPVVVVNNDETSSSDSTIDDAASSYLVGGEVEAEVVAVGEEKRKRRVELEEQSIWNQMKEIVMFTGPVAGMWFCGPLMSLIDTVVIGQSSSLELAALGPAAVVCDYTGYVFMFLSIATSNMVATSLAKQDKNEVQHRISILLFVGLVCGVSMLCFTKVFGEWALTAFTGQKNVHLVPAADTYIQIRGLSWPAVLIGWVAQSASLGMKDSWGPLKALVVASLVNGIGDIFLCSYLGYGIAGAAWATMFSQVISAYMMVDALNKKGYNAFAFSVPSPPELVEIAALAAPAFVTMISRVTFYGLVVYFATSAGTHSVAAHQVMLQTGSMSTIFGGPLSQTAQSFMPELLYGINRSLKKARRLLKSLLIIGWSIGLVSVTIGTIVPWLFPNIFTSDPAIVREMHSVLIPYIIAFSAAPATQTLEGALVAGRELNFLSSSMCVCFALGISLLMIFSNRGFGLRGCWYALVGFQWARFLSALQRLLARDGVLFSDKGDQQERTNLTPAA